MLAFLSKGLDGIVKIQNCDLSSVKFCLCVSISFSDLEAFLKSEVPLKTKGSSVLFVFGCCLFQWCWCWVLWLFLLGGGGGGGGGGEASYTVSTHDI